MRPADLAEDRPPDAVLLLVAEGIGLYLWQDELDRSLMVQEAKVTVEDRAHPATVGLPETFRHIEEWYSFESSPRLRGARVLISVDESTYALEMGWLGLLLGNELEMGDHPVVWSHCPGKGRALFSALGHQAAAYDVPEHRALLEGAVGWAAGLNGDECKHALAPVGR